MMSPFLEVAKVNGTPGEVQRPQDSKLQIVFILHSAASDTKSYSEERLKVIK
jgi:hypothetical protein